MTLQCPDGHINPDGATFCDQCGKPLTAIPTSQNEAPPPLALPVAMSEDLEATHVAPTAPALQEEPVATQMAAEEAPTMPAPAPEPDALVPEVAAPAPEPVVVAPEPAVVASAPAPALAHPRLVVQKSGTIIELAGKTVALVGREDAPSNSFPDVDLSPYGAEEGGVSRLHARFALTGEQWTIEDLESTNFTFVNGKRIPPKTPTPLNDGAEIRLGRVALRFTTSS